MVMLLLNKPRKQEDIGEGREKEAGGICIVVLEKNVKD